MGHFGAEPSARPNVVGAMSKATTVEGAEAHGRFVLESGRFSDAFSKARQDVGGISTTRPSWRPKSQTSIAGGSMPSVVRAVQIWLR
jgi:hypothetical protein